MTALDPSARVAWTSDIEAAPAETRSYPFGSSSGLWAFPTDTSPART